MGDIELVIKISEEDFEIMKHNIAINNPLCPLSQEEMVSKVAKGMPLPKGHGRILDEKDILDTENNDGGWYDLTDMAEYIAGVKAIIEADKAESEEV